MNEWQPIETAPKDTLIDIWVQHIFVQRGRIGFRACDAKWVKDHWQCVIPLSGTARIISEEDIIGGRQFITHWMPRPDPPGVEK